MFSYGIIIRTDNEELLPPAIFSRLIYAIDMCS